VDRRRWIARNGWLLTLVALLAGCGGSGTATLAPAPTAEARATVLAATATAIAASGPPATPVFFPANPPSAVAATANQPIQPATATKEGVPLEGTPLSIPEADGQLVKVGERRLWIACRGEGTPTVVMDAGVNSGSRVWSLVWPATAAATRVCVYDRAGLGRSDPIPRPRTSEEVVDDLHGLLENSGVTGPYVLVAHSFGGLNVRLYASRYPNDVVGLVLVDAVHEDRFAATAKVLTPRQQSAFERDRQANPEGLDYYESSRLVRAIGPALPAIPTIVIARGRADPWPRGYPVAEMERVWRDLQKDLASRSPQGRLLIAEQSDHNIPGNQPEIVIEATREVVARVRGG
jgi:pimeloyl-ACP methyl ester carboxylesterase